MNETSEQRAPRPPGTFRVGSVAGADVLVSGSWFVIAAIIAVLVQPRVEQVRPGLGAGAYLAGFAFAVILYLSVLLHEASHAHMARRYGYRVKSIVLHFLGGATTVEQESRRPREEFWIAVVGPLTSIAVGVAAVGLWFVTPDGLLKLAVEGLAGANLLVGVLNLVPGLPLDGGRVLKAGVWAASGNMHRGTIAAGWGGRITGLLVLLWPWAQQQFFGVPPDLLDFLLAAFIGFFLWAGANAAIASARIRSRLPSLVARDLARRTLLVPEDLPLSEAIRRAQEEQAGGIITTDPGGHPTGLVNEQAVLATPDDRRPWMAVQAVTRKLEEGLMLPVGIAGEGLVEAISQRPANEYVLRNDDGSIYGVLSVEDLNQAFRGLQGKPATS